MVGSGSGEISFYDVAGAQLTARASAYVGLFPYGMAVDSNTGTVFVANRLSEDTARVRPTLQVDNRVLGNASGGRTGESPVGSPEANFFWTDGALG